MSSVALLEYFTTPESTVVFLVKPAMEEPRVFEVRQGERREPVGSEQLLRCAERLMVDFHGLPRGWDTRSHAANYRTVLSLTPAVHAAKRSQPMLQANLGKPAYSYQLTYFEELSEALLPPALRDEIVDCDLLYIVPHGPLHALPFAALRWSPDKYLVERFGICFAHSASILKYCQAKNRVRILGNNHRPSSCFVAAVAAADDQDPESFEADAGILADLFRAQALHRTVTCLVGAKAHAGSQPASKELILKHLGTHDVIHFACHGLFGAADTGADPLASGLLVSDGQKSLPLFEGPAELDLATRTRHVLSAHEVFGLRLTTDLVTLRACSSGRAEVRSGDELLGLTRAFLYAGVPSLLVSLWDVNQRSSQRLLSEFYQRWLDPDRPQAKWQALREAQMSLLQDPDPRYRHPYHWAPFVLMGDWL